MSVQTEKKKTKQKKKRKNFSLRESSDLIPNVYSEKNYYNEIQLIVGFKCQ